MLNVITFILQFLWQGGISEPPAESGDPAPGLSGRPGKPTPDRRREADVRPEARKYYFHITFLIAGEHF